MYKETSKKRGKNYSTKKTIRGGTLCEGYGAKNITGGQLTDKSTNNKRIRGGYLA
jgi:hypothetical protein